MSAWQLRTGKTTSLDILAGELAARFEEVLTDHPRIASLCDSRLEKLRQLTRDRISQSVEAYRVCGDQKRCHACSTPARIAGPWAQPSASPNEPILLLKDGFSELSVRFAADIFDRFCPNATTKEWLSLKESLTRALEETLAPFLYDNPYCENCPRCTPDTRVSPWSTP